MNTKRRQGGSILLDVCLSVLCVILGGVLLVTVIQRRQQHLRCARYIADLRDFSAAFLSFKQRQGNWPPASSGVAAIPRGMESYLRDTNWLTGSPVGGSYSWVAPGEGNAAGKPDETGAIALTAFFPALPLALSPADLRYIDAELDDGNLASGRFRTGFNGWPLYLVRD